MKKEISFSLKKETVNSISQTISDFLQENKTERIFELRAKLLLEELLMILLNGVEEINETTFKLTLAKKSTKLWIGIDYPGKRFNPIEREQMDVFSDMLLQNLDMEPVWSYISGVNRITITVPYTKDKKELQYVKAAVLAILAVLLGNVIPDGVRSALTRYILTPFSDIFMDLLAVISPMLIFLGVVLSIINNGSMSSQQTRNYIVRRYIAASIVLTIISTVALIPFFHFSLGSGLGELSASMDILFQMIMDLVPKNLIQPFTDGNIPQILILAFLFGTVIQSLDNRGDRISTSLGLIYDVFLHAVDYVSILLPVFIFSSLTALLWENGINIIISLWKPVLALILVYILLILLYVFYVAFKYKASVSVLLKKIYPSALIGFTTASSMAAFGKVNEINETLGIEKTCNDFTVAIGGQLYCGAVSAVFLAIAYYLAEAFQTPVDIKWFFVAGIITLIISLASPPVSGGTLICLNIMMGSLGIPAKGLAVASTLALLFDFISTGSYIAMRHMEMVIQAGHLDMLDVDTLRAAP